MPFAVMPLHPGPNVFQDDHCGLADPVASSSPPFAVQIPQAGNEIVVVWPGGVNCDGAQFDHEFLQRLRSSCPGVTRASTLFVKTMDCRIKSGNDEWHDE
jgi:hypothetical protein